MTGGSCGCEVGLLIRNPTLLDFRDLSSRTGVDLRIEGGRIREIGPDLAVKRARPRRDRPRPGRPADKGPPAGKAAQPPGAAAGGGEEQVIEASGLYLIPGLVNLHCHSAMTLLRGAAEDMNEPQWFNDHVWIYERNLQPRDVYWGTLLGAAEMLRCGVTWVADHYFHMDQAYQAYRQAGMRADLCWAVFGTGQGWPEQYDRALEFVREYSNREPRLTISLGPHSPYVCPQPFLRQVADKAAELGLKTHIHVAEMEEQVRQSLSESGKTPVEVLQETGLLRPGTILAHAYYATDRDLDLIREAGAGVAHCAKTYLKFGDVNDFLPRALAAGAAVGLGSDGPCSANTLSIFEAARDAAFLAKCSRDDAEAAPIGQILPLVHRGGEILGLPGYGGLEAGRPADMVLIDPRTPAMTPETSVFANLLYSLSDSNIHTVIVDGRVVVRAGQLLSVDMEEVTRKASEIAARITRRDHDSPLQCYLDTER